MMQLPKSTFAIGGAIFLIIVAGFLLFKVTNPKTPDWVTATVERGDVAEIVSVSGFVEAENTAELSFPTTGVVTEVYAQEGVGVRQGEVLATLGETQLAAQRNEALANLRAAEARYDKLIAGADTTDKDIATTNLTNAKLSLERTKSEEDAKVANARAVLLSDDLEALSVDPKDDATAPEISGTYRCESEGSYTLEVYSSNAFTRYSYRISGLENGAGTVSTDQPSALGSCGLYIQFTADDSYQGSVWQIDIPNTRSSSYVTNKNTFELASTQRDNAIAEAEDVLNLTQLQSNGVMAPARSEEVREALAAIDQAHATIEEIDARLRDRSIVAPFDGVITDVSILRGETAQTDPVITILADDAFELKARIPEIDITKLKKDQTVTAVFDAEPADVQTGVISYISPLAVMIDGVAYFEAAIELTNTPSWLRSGLNADVDIIVGEKKDVLRIPKRFLIDNADGTHSVRIARGSQVATTTVRLEFSGNDGFIEVTGLNEGDTVVAP